MSLALGAGLCLIGCGPTTPGKPGERAEAGGKCPMGETCSALTPGGLRLVGARLGGAVDFIFAGTALYGTQTITALYGTEPHVPFVAGFDAQIVDERVARMETKTQTAIQLRGASEGKTLLRLLEQGTNNLLDRIEIQVEPVAQARLIPVEYALMEEEPWAMLAGSRPLLWASLYGSGGDIESLLVDEDLRVASHGAEVFRRAWDLYEVVAPPSGRVSFAIEATSRQFAVDSEVVTYIDAISSSEDESASRTPLNIRVGRDKEVCFTARSNGKRVAGAIWTFETPENNGIADISGETTLRQPNCINLKGVKVGNTTLSAKADTHSDTFDVVVDSGIIIDPAH